MRPSRGGAKCAKAASIGLFSVFFVRSDTYCFEGMQGRRLDVSSFFLWWETNGVCFSAEDIAEGFGLRYCKYS